MDFEPDYVTLATDNIVVSACQELLDDDDSLCAYYLKIENNSDEPIQILGKDFNLTDAKGNNYTSFDRTFDGEILSLNPGEYFEFEDTLPAMADCSVLYGTCQIAQAQNQIKNIRIPNLQLYSNKKCAVVLN